MICIAAGSTENTGVLSPRGKGRDLQELRTGIALAGHRAGWLDIYGRYWPRGVSRGDSRNGAWALAKYKILPEYHFNLCFENTLFPYYCSEKIWHSIYCGCLPIYYGQETIYETFPRGSFLDYAELGTPETLFERITSMSSQEFADRYNRCLDVFQAAWPLGDRSRQRAAEYTVQQIRQLVAPPPATP